MKILLGILAFIGLIALITIILFVWCALVLGKDDRDA